MEPYINQSLSMRPEQLYQQLQDVLPASRKADLEFPTTQLVLAAHSAHPRGQAVAPSPSDRLQRFIAALQARGFFTQEEKLLRPGRLKAFGALSSDAARLVERIGCLLLCAMRNKAPTLPHEMLDLIIKELFLAEFTPSAAAAGHLLDACLKPWFKGAINAKAAHDLLKGEARGTWIARFSEAQDCLCISVKTANGVQHGRLAKLDATQSLEQQLAVIAASFNADPPQNSK